MSVYQTDKGIYIKTGCFMGTLAKFTAAVKAEHGTNVHGKEYAAAIAMVKAWVKLWGPRKAATDKGGHEGQDESGALRAVVP
jgi:hypothetical protein